MSDTDTDTDPDPIRDFFKVELRNEMRREAATLGSAHDSLCQAPMDVIASWLGLTDEEPTHHLIEFGMLLQEHGPDTLLRDLL